MVYTKISRGTFSNDTISWVNKINGPSTVGYDVAHNENETWVVVGEGDISVSYSTDNGATFTGLSNTNFNENDGVTLTWRSVTWTGKYFVAVGTINETDSKIAYSLDGINWTSLNPYSLLQNNLESYKQTDFYGDIKINGVSVNPILEKTSNQSLVGNTTTFEDSITINNVSNPILLIQSNGGSNEPGGQLLLTERETEWGWNIQHNAGNTDNLIIQALRGSSQYKLMSFSNNYGVKIENESPNSNFTVNCNSLFNDSITLASSLKYSNTEFKIQSVNGTTITDRLLIPISTGTKIKLLNSGLNNNSSFLKLNANYEIVSAEHNDTNINNLETSVGDLETSVGDLETSVGDLETLTANLDIKTYFITRDNTTTYFQNNIFIDGNIRLSDDRTGTTTAKMYFITNEDDNNGFTMYYGNDENFHIARRNASTTDTDVVKIEKSSGTTYFYNKVEFSIGNGIAEFTTPNSNPGMVFRGAPNDDTNRVNLELTNDSFYIRYHDNSPSLRLYNGSPSQIQMVTDRVWIGGDLVLSGGISANDLSLSGDINISKDDYTDTIITLRTNISHNRASKIRFYETNYTSNVDYGWDLGFSNGTDDAFKIQSVVSTTITDRLLIPRNTGTKIKLLNSGLTTSRFLRLNTSNEIESAQHDDSDINTLETKTLYQSASSNTTTFTGDFTINKTSNNENVDFRLSSGVDGTSKMYFIENSDNHGFTMFYEGSGNNFHIARRDASSTDVDVIKIARGGGTNFYGTTTFNDNVTVNGTTTFNDNVTANGNVDIHNTYNSTLTLKCGQLPLLNLYAKINYFEEDSNGTDAPYGFTTYYNSNTNKFHISSVADNVIINIIELKRGFEQVIFFDAFKQYKDSGDVSNSDVLRFSYNDEPYISIGDVSEGYNSTAITSNSSNNSARSNGIMCNKPIYIGVNNFEKDSASKGIRITYDSGGNLYFMARQNRHDSSRIKIYGYQISGGYTITPTVGVYFYQSIYVNGSVQTPSDERIKENIIDYPHSSLDIINKIQMKQYTYKYNNKPKTIGVISNQIKKDIDDVYEDTNITQVNELITVNDDPENPIEIENLISIQKDKLFLHSIHAVQELSQKLEASETKVAQLESKVVQLESQLQAVLTHLGL